MNGTKRIIFGEKNVIYGKQTVACLPEELKKHRCKHAFICTDQNLSKSSLFKEFIDLIASADLQITVFDQIVPNPRAGDIMAGSKVFLERGADCVIGFGGGSTLDSAKAIAAISCNEGDIIEYNTHHPARRFFKKKSYYSVCIPTTAGTGSEMDGVAVIVNQNGHKVNIIDPLLSCDLAIVDPTLIYGCPSRVIASCGIDAFCHSFEALIGNPDMLFDNVILRGIKNVYSNLLGACKGRDNYYKDKLMEASMIGGFAIENEPSPGGVPIHSIGLPLAEKYHLAHGESLSAVLPYIVDRIIEDRGPAAVAKAGRFCGIDEEDDNICAKVFVMNLQELIILTGLQLPEHLTAGREDIEELAERATRSTSTTRNKILPFDFDMCCEVYQRAFAHDLIKIN